MRILVIAILLIFSVQVNAQTREYIQGEWRLKLGLPYLNNFNLNPEKETRQYQTGWVGFSAGIEYQITHKNFLSFEYSGNGAAEAFGLMDIVGEYDIFACHSLNLSRNTIVGRLSVGYGINYAQLLWRYTRSFMPDSIPPSRELVLRKSQNLGLILNTYYRFGNSFHLGLIYRPYFLKFRPENSWDYEHVISLDCMWKIRIVK